MGLIVRSLASIPIEVKKEYFIYLLDYGWDEPIRKILDKNFDKMAREAESNEAVIIRSSIEESHFEDDVFSWHKINGLSGEDILPAILISNTHPQYFHNSSFQKTWGKSLLNENQDSDMKLILIPFKKFFKILKEKEIFCNFL